MEKRDIEDLIDRTLMDIKDYEEGLKDESVNYMHEEWEVSLNWLYMRLNQLKKEHPEYFV